MKISLKWLSEYIELKDMQSQPAELAALLTAAGIEVDGLEDAARTYQHVVVGHIVEFGRHPDADRLTLCQVDVGDGRRRQIVCGAKNHKQGDKVVAALPGAVLPGNFEIKKSKIRGVESEGMLCSDKELALSTESEGIRILPADAPIGVPFAQFMGLDDVIMDLSVTPNRADCLSHVGLAREIGCVLGRESHLPKTPLRLGRFTTSSQIRLQHQDTELCPRYAGRSIKGVKVGPSPEWLKRRLEAVGVNSINNVVDVTNFVMLELGQPLHAFDVRSLNGGQIHIARAQKGEAFTTLDGTELKLSGEELTIRDGERPVALAGVVGGKNSGVSESTQDLFIESAHFTPQSVRRTARRLGIETDSSYRFSRGTDPEMVITALHRACSLIQELAGGEVAEDEYDSYPKPALPVQIECRLSQVSERLGYAADASEFQQWMQRLGAQVEVLKAGSEFRVQPPLYRWDLNVEVDLIEEYGRLHGYQHIPEAFPALAQAPSHHAVDYVVERRLGAMIRAQGFHQAVNYNFLAEDFLKTFYAGCKLPLNPGVEWSDQWVRLRNPLSEDTNVMRNSLLPSLFKNAVNNVRSGQAQGSLFELGFAFKKDPAGYPQSFRLGLISWGKKVSLWQKDENRALIFDLKGAVEGVLRQLRSSAWSWHQLAADQVPAFLHPGQSASLFYEGRNVGVIGTLHPQLRAEFKLRADVAVGELDVEALWRGQPRLPKLKALSKYPAVERDFAFVLPDTLPAAEVLRYIQKVAGPELQSVDIFDLYKGTGVGENQRSVTFKLVYQSEQETLSEEKLTQFQQKVIQEVAKKFAIEVR